MGERRRWGRAQHGRDPAINVAADVPKSHCFQQSIHFNFVIWLKLSCVRFYCFKFPFFCCFPSKLFEYLRKHCKRKRGGDFEFNKNSLVWIFFVGEIPALQSDFATSRLLGFFMWYWNLRDWHQWDTPRKVTRQGGGGGGEGRIVF